MKEFSGKRAVVVNDGGSCVGRQIRVQLAASGHPVGSGIDGLLSSGLGVRG